MNNILCIDDIESNLFTLKSVLQSAKNTEYNILSATSAHKGLDILLKEKVDLILLDIMMPEVDGFLCAKMIKKNRRIKNIPIIFVTAKTDDETIKQCYEVGGSDYITKPLNSVELLARISFHLEAQEKEKMLEYEKEYTQNILDLQENLILVTDGKKPLNVNKRLLEFYGSQNIKEFNKKYDCICTTFVEEEGYFYKDTSSSDCFWIETILDKSKSENVLVKIKAVGKETVFTIKIVKFEYYFIVTLTDITKISNLSHRFEHEANYDALTQIYNRNIFHTLIDEKIQNQKDVEKPFTLLLIDIDFFKKVNDTYGHLVGDEVLKGVVKVIQKNIRQNDIFVRWRGEEFILLLDVYGKKSLEIANSLRLHINKENFDTVGHITCSFGLTYFREDDSLENMIKRADEALYNAKTGGRDKVCKN